MDNLAVVTRFTSLKEKCQSLLSKKADVESLRVLDIGCGMGVQARVWARDGYRVTACDIDKDLIAAGKVRGEADGLNIEWVVGSASETTLPDATFDVCLAVELLEHVVDWQGAIREFERVLRPGGVLLLPDDKCDKPRAARVPTTRI